MSAHQPEEYWNEIYSKSPYKFGKAPSPFLVEMLPKLRTGKVLDIGMGEGANSVYLAQKGFAVKGFDLSSTAIEHAQKLAQETGVAIEAKKADLDLFLFGLLEYDSIVMMYFKPSVPRYYSEIIRALKQGGTLLVESWTSEEIKDIIGPDETHRDYYYRSNELLKGLAGMRILFYQEDVINGYHTVRCLAQKPLDRDVAKYGLFDMASGPKDTGPSAAQKLAESLFKKKP
jgi:SAM-dependent methyltransferase